MMHTEQDKRMMTSPNDWPRWPYLPVKKRNRVMDPKGLGILVEVNRQVLPTVYHVNLFSPFAYHNLAKAEKTVFSSFDEMIQAGWIVD